MITMSHPDFFDHPFNLPGAPAAVGETHGERRALHQYTYGLYDKAVIFMT